MTRRERLQRRAERRRAWAAGNRSRAAASFDRADMSEERTGIPLGQPVLVGHHSERRHRRTIDRAASAMRKGIEHESKAKHHEQVADTIDHQLDASIFSDDADAVERLESKLASLEARRASIKSLSARCRKGDAEAIAIVSAARGGTPRGFEPYVLTNLGGQIRQVKIRIAEVKRRARVTAAAAEAPAGVTVTGGAEWIAVTFAEKPAYQILQALRGAGFRWTAPSWHGRREHLPACVSSMIGGERC